MGLLGDLVDGLLGGSGNGSGGSVNVSIGGGGAGGSGTGTPTGSDSGTGTSTNVGTGDGGIDIDIGGSDAGGDGTGGVSGTGGEGTSTSTSSHSKTVTSDSPSTDHHKMMSFHISNGQVTSVFQLVNGELIPVSLEPNEFFTLDGNDVIHNKILHFGTEATRYGDPDHDGYFTRQSELWTVTVDGAESGKPLPVITQLLTFSPTNGNDFVAVRDGEYTLAGAGSDSFVFREAGHLQIGDFNASEGDKLIIDTALGITSQEQLEGYVTGINYENDNLVVSFGPAVSITLVGVGPGEIGWGDVSVLS